MNLSFGERVISWQRQYGRHHLPWQQNKNPYKVWLSEIMLQQTQVATVLPYYKNFLQLFPSVTDLANAEEDTIMSMWAGLGYYNRARNMHRCAQIVRDEFEGQFPRCADQLETLPGIGRSTAGAIASLAMGLPTPILDGNVKRVLSRFYKVTQWYGNAKTMKKLWAYAEQVTPMSNTDVFNQGMMDLGAMICTRSKPDCRACPLSQDCIAHQQGLTDQLPVSKPKKAATKIKYAWPLILQAETGELLFEKRPSTGIWPALSSFPEYMNTHHESDITPAGTQIRDWVQQSFNLQIDDIQPLERFSHKFTHYQLEISPIKAVIQRKESRIMEPKFQWYSLEQTKQIGLPTPIAKILKKIQR
jgi:A/G-specific adenine glycosylase